MTGAGRQAVETFDSALPDDIQQLAIALMEEICELDLTLAVAESCTGGLIAAVLTDVEGCSHGFDRSFVVYTDAAKAETLDVSWATLKGCGAVSAKAARELCNGALAKSSADLALSVTGFAGPGAPDEEPGLVFFGAARRGEPAEVLERHYGELDRAAVRRACLRDGLALLRRLAQTHPAAG